MRTFRFVLLLCVPLWLVLDGCQLTSVRRCLEDQDCANSAPKLTCLEGVCSEKNCAPGAHQRCFEGSDPKRQSQGLCRPGLRFCKDDGQWSRCLQQILPQQEICDRLDNDCNGKIDDLADQKTCACPEPGAQRACYSGASGALQGICRQGVQYCETDFLWGRCYGQQLPQDEVCDGLDNDCNGKIDEHPSCGCNPGDEQECYTGPIDTREVGICRAGKQRCTDQKTWGACQQEQLPMQEVQDCDGKDNDCDGQIDEGCKRCSDAKPCPTGQGCCSGACVDLQSSTSHCGTCTTACKAGESCCSGGCVNTQTAPKHCGACNKSCSVDQSCQGGVCQKVTSCQAPQSDCGGACVDLQTDPKHCGVCNKACEAGESCQSGACQKEKGCQAPQFDCGGGCVDLQTDPKHCGSCGNLCSTQERCTKGTCQTACDPNKLEFCPNQLDDNCDGMADLMCDIVSPTNAQDDEITHLVVDGQDNLYFAGTFKGTLKLGSNTLNVQPPQSTGSNAYIAKYTSAGTFAWVVQLSSSVELNALTYAPTGHLYLVGRITGSTTLGGKGITPTGRGAGLLAKVDATNGKFLWSKVLQNVGTNGNVQIDRIGLNSKGESITLGSFNGSLQIANSTYPASGTNAFVLWTDAQGNHKLLTTTVGQHIVSNAALVVDSQDSVYIAGNWSGTALQVGAFRLPQSSKMRAFIAKFDTNGAPKWATQPDSGTTDHFLFGMALDANKDRLFITGGFSANINFDAIKLSPGSSGFSAYIAALDPATSKFQWARALDNKQQTTGFHIAYDHKKAKVVGLGRFHTKALTFGTQTVTNKGAFDLYLTRLDSNGQFDSLTSIGDTSTVAGNGLFISPNGGTYIYGYFNQTLHFRNATFPTKGGKDGFIAIIGP